MKAIERKYGRDFGVSSNKKLGNSLKKMGYSSLSALLTTEDEKPER